MGKINKNFVKCDLCNLKAVVNFQKIWVKFTINKDGKYKKDKTFCGGDFEQPINEDNIHFCKKHLKEWLNRD